MKHETVHMKQWKLYGRTFIVMYAGEMWYSYQMTRTYACANLFEIQAGL